MLIRLTFVMMPTFVMYILLYLQKLYCRPSLSKIIQDSFNIRLSAEIKKRLDSQRVYFSIIS